MPPRLGSPARSENEFDISSALFGEDTEINHDSPDKHNGGLRGDDVDIMAEESEVDEEAIIAAQQAASNRKGANLKGRTVKKGGGFQAMGLNANLLKAITRKGFSVPTPIQRKTIPLLLGEKDVVGMARTGSGKTAAFVIPMIEKLKAHSTKVGARALVLAPSRELALQTLKVVKELGRGTDLRSILLVGGDSLEDQFSAMSNNPDIIIATPGRFLHLKVEMNLDLLNIKYVVFDEADRLFEMGFAAQLTEILHALPASRQTLLFSATLPKSLVEFARAGLQEPMLVRLDADSKISPDLQSAFFTLKSSEKEGALLHILQEIVQMPTRSQLITSTMASRTADKSNNKKRKHHETEENSSNISGPNPYSTIVFTATKHHVEYIASLLRLAGYAVSYVYGSLDQTARKSQVHAFRSSQTNILVVTDVAARGIDIPVLANVINYDFPSQPKIFVHRVGRTARAGQRGWSYSLVRDADAPYLLDLQLFLGRKLVLGRAASSDIVNFAQDVVVGSFRREEIQTSCEWVTKTLESDSDLSTLRNVALKGEKLYQRTRNSASSESAKRSKVIVSSPSWSELHSLFNDETDDVEVEREKMLARVGGFRPQESIFEIGARRGGRKNNEDAVDAIRKIRSGFECRKQKIADVVQARTEVDDDALAQNGSTHGPVDEDAEPDSNDDRNDIDGMSEASLTDLEITFSQPYSKKSKPSKSSKAGLRNTDEDFRDPENFMSYHPTTHDLTSDRAYGVHSGSNTNASASFVESARTATMDLGADESSKTFGENRGIMRWDKRHKKYVRRDNDEDGSKTGKRLVKGESGAKIAASFRSGRFERWMKANRMSRLGRIGEEEKTFNINTGGLSVGGARGKKFQHRSQKTPKQPDKLRGDYEKQVKKVRGAKEREEQSAGKAKGELRNVDRIVKERRLKEKRREKNARPRRRKV
ncbi:ATP-dependent RNA helicase dbp10 [Cladophialophora psammophila CBS 110553]|uniref:ATP-dependent RNA helicase DBP10 n=1 Tax=Cladophialophora psammophila CBS 110553 TaxID=1182543 RepID=W9X675_9EURO|nr:ATP-dependent RNA helicase dbp10 [Cladophialophora psammophila CBS 110553]EXJ65949.1 ATP-dependent RNA helicase dbp10 [Cladophialophora psammophila CBS 110553]